MKPINFKQANVKIAEKQKEYQTLPAFRDREDEEGRVTSCWQLSFWDWLRVLFTGKIYFQVLTFGGSLQPQMPAASFWDLYIKKLFKRHYENA